jgi:hypothetical protein
MCKAMVVPHQVISNLLSPQRLVVNTLPSDLHLVDSNNGSPCTDGYKSKSRIASQVILSWWILIKVTLLLMHPKTNSNPYQSESQIAIHPVSKRRPSVDTRGIQSISRFSMLLEPTNIIEDLLLKRVAM